MRAVANKFERNLLEKGIKPQTVSAYLRDVQILFLHINKPGKKRSLEALDEEDLKNILDVLKATKAESGLRHWVTSISKFMDFCVEQGIRQENPMTRVLRPQTDRSSMVNEKDVAKKLLKHLKKDTRLSQRNRAIVALLCCSDMKISEFHKLTLGGFDETRRFIMDSMGRKHPLNKTAMDIFRVYVSCTFFDGDDPATPLFFSQKSQTMTRQCVWKVVKQALDDAGLDPDISPIRLRGVLIK